MGDDGSVIIFLAVIFLLALFETLFPEKTQHNKGGETPEGESNVNNPDQSQR